MIFMFAAGGLWAQQIIENPAKPLSKNAGRVVTPREVLTITDEGASDFYFKWPHNLKVAADGSIYLADEGQLLQFDSAGRFVRNFQKKGQGPGEIEYVNDYEVAEAGLVVLAANPSRLVWFDRSAKYIKQAAIGGSEDWFLAMFPPVDGTHYLHSVSSSRIEGEARIIDVNQVIKAWSEGNKDMVERIAFPTQAFAAAVGGSSGYHEMNYLVWAPYKNGCLALNHTAEYLIKVYDFKSNKVIAQFRRPYRRVEQVPLPEEKRGKLILNGKTFYKPDQKYEPDVACILIHGNDIWVVTSTRDKNKGVLVDVFNDKGQYLDALYLNLNASALENLKFQGQCRVIGDALYIIEQNGDGISAIRKYRLEGIL